MKAREDGDSVQPGTPQGLRASAFRARRADPCPVRALRVRDGAPLPLHNLPVPPLPTDSAAAPARAAPRRRPPAPPRPDPAYERRLEELAQAMLAQSQPILEEQAVTTRRADTQAYQHSEVLPDRPAPAEETPVLPGREDTLGRREPTLAPLPYPLRDDVLRPRRRRRAPVLLALALSTVAIGLASAWWWGQEKTLDGLLASVRESIHAASGDSASDGSNAGSRPDSHPASAGTQQADNASAKPQMGAAGSSALAQQNARAADSPGGSTSAPSDPG